MLKFMENDEKIFRAWLKKHVKIDRKITGKKLSERTGIKGPSITSYHSGRIIDGERVWPSIPFDKRVSILKATGVSYEDMMRIGKNELESEGVPDREGIKAYVRELLSETSKEGSSKKIISIDQKHAEIIKKFQNRDMALAINQELLDLESIDPDKLKSVLDFIRWQKKEAEEAAKKRDAGNDKQ
jgi:hypothetical protein